jgi:hypothetical protein
MTIGTSSGNVGYSHPAVTGATTGLTVARYPEVAMASVDETRPVNMALLPCIKY